MNYSAWAVNELIDDYRRDFGISLTYEDAIRMMLLVDMLAEVCEKYEGGGGDDISSFMAPLLDY